MLSPLRHRAEWSAAQVGFAQGGYVVRRLITLAILAASISLALVACGGYSEPTPTPQPPSPPPPRPPVPLAFVEAPPPSACTADAKEATRTIRVVNRDPAGSEDGEYRFDPNEFTIKLGETVSFEMVAQTELHSFTVDELGIDIDIDGAETPGKTETRTCTFNKAGTFNLTCIYHVGHGMVGKITVQ